MVIRTSDTGKGACRNQYDSWVKLAFGAGPSAHANEPRLAAVLHIVIIAQFEPSMYRPVGSVHIQQCLEGRKRADRSVPSGLKSIDSAHRE